MSLASLGLAASVIAFSVKFVNPRATFQVPPSPSSKAGDRVSIVIGVAAAETVADPNANAIPTAAKIKPRRTKITRSLDLPSVSIVTPATREVHGGYDPPRGGQVLRHAALGRLPLSVDHSCSFCSWEWFRGKFG